MITGGRETDTNRERNLKNQESKSKCVNLHKDVEKSENQLSCEEGKISTNELS